MQEELVEVDAMPMLNRSHTSRSDSLGLPRADHEEVVAACAKDDSNRMVLPLIGSAASNNAHH
jgi:hypothetical protein